MKNLFFILLALCLYFQLSSATLKMVVEVFRHGHRGPIKKVWNYQNFSKYSFGELTPIGMRQHYILGKQMRQKYTEDQHFIDGYDQNHVYVRSSDVNRTIVSAQSHLMGFFLEGTGPKLENQKQIDIAIPPYNNLTVNAKSLQDQALPNGFQAVPIHVVSRDQDLLLVSDLNCEILEDLNEEYKKTEYFKILKQHFLENVKEAAKLIDFKGSFDLDFVEDIMDVFYADLYEKLPLPQDLHPELLQNLTLLNSFMWQLKYYSQTQQIKLLNTVFYKNLIDILDAKIRGEDQRKFIIYSAHDTTISPIGAGLNLTSIDCLMEKFLKGSTNAINCEFGYPVYASQLLFELHLNESDQKYYIQVIYNGKEINLCEKKQTTCEYEEFKSRLQQYILDDIQKACKKQQKEVHRKIKHKKFFEKK